MNHFKIVGGQPTKLQPNLSLKHGQIIRGKVAKLFPDNKAQIQLTNQNIIAKLEASLILGEKYHFQVQRTNHVLYLKIIGEKLKNQPKADSSKLLRYLGIKATKDNQSFIQKLMNEGIPFELSQIKVAFDLLPVKRDQENAQRILLEMIERKLPLTNEVYEALHTYNTSKQSELMRGLMTQLPNSNEHMHLHDLLSNLTLSTGMDLSFLNMNAKDQFLYHVNQFFTFTGLNYEYNLRKHLVSQNQTIKEMLLQLVTNGADSNLEYASKLLDLINGMQLNAVNESHAYIHINVKIPGERLGLLSDLELEVESRKTSSGKINPDHCRIQFYLELFHLKETLIEMNIQQRLVSITIFNNTELLRELTTSLQPSLKKGLKALNYTLTSVSFKSIEQREKTSHLTYNPSYSGVDYHI